MACDVLPLRELPSLPTPQISSREKPKHPLLLGWRVNKGALQQKHRHLPRHLSRGNFLLSSSKLVTGFTYSPKPPLLWGQILLRSWGPRAITPPAPAGARCPPGSRVPGNGGKRGWFLSEQRCCHGWGRASTGAPCCWAWCGDPELTSEPQRGACERRRRQKQHQGFLLVWGHGAALEWAVLCS